MKKILSLAAITFLLAGCGAVRSEAWNLGYDMGSEFEGTASLGEAKAGCEFSLAYLFPSASNSEYNDFMDGCITAATE